MIYIYLGMFGEYCTKYCVQRHIALKPSARSPFLAKRKSKRPTNGTPRRGAGEMGSKRDLLQQHIFRGKLV